MAGLGRIWRGTIGVLSALALAGIADAQAPASTGKAIERKLLVASFENIVVIGDISVTVTTGKSPSAIASGDKRVLESLKLERVGTTLRVRLQDVINNQRGVPITAPLTVRLTTQEIKDITLERQWQSGDFRSEAAGPCADADCRQRIGDCRAAGDGPVFRDDQRQWQDRPWAAAPSAMRA